MKAKDIMTRQVVSVDADEPVGAIAKLLLERNISGVPVVDEGNRVIGIVSEGDLIFRHEIGTDQPKHSWWLRLLNDNAGMVDEYLKTHGKTARDVMTRDVMTVTEETPVVEIARLMEKNHIKRLPVVKDGILVGIVSRANIMRQVAAERELHVAMYIDDETLRRQVEETLEKEPWASVGLTNVTVNAGTVEFWGMVGSESERDATRVAISEIAGVKQVVDHRHVRTAVPLSGL